MSNRHGQVGRLTELGKGFRPTMSRSNAKALFDMFGITPPADLQAEWESRDKDKSKKLKSELAAAAKYGEPSSQFYPRDEQLRQITAAAKVGYFVPQMLSVGSSLRGKRLLGVWLFAKDFTK